MSTARSHQHLTRHDDIYHLLMDVHEGKSEPESLKISAKLILFLMNHIGDDIVCMEIIRQVKREYSHE